MRERQHGLTRREKRERKRKRNYTRYRVAQLGEGVCCVDSIAENKKEKRKRLGKTRDVLSDVDGETSDSRGSVKQHVDRPRVTSTPRHTHLSVLACLATVSDSALHLLAPQGQQKKQEKKREKKRRGTERDTRE